MSSWLHNTGANLLDDVDPAASHTQCTDYQHVLDPYGTMLGEDVGRTCTYGVAGIKQSGAYEYCGKCYGFSGATIMAAGGGVVFPGGAPKTLKDDFSRCKLFTHFSGAMVPALTQAGVVLDNGDTADGCSVREAVGTCPTGEIGDDVKILGLSIVVFAVIVAIVAVMIIVAVWKCICGTSKVGSA